jgi:hypothetical protein
VGGATLPETAEHFQRCCPGLMGSSGGPRSINHPMVPNCYIWIYYISHLILISSESLFGDELQFPRGSSAFAPDRPRAEKHLHLVGTCAAAGLPPLREIASPFSMDGPAIAARLLNRNKKCGCRAR